MLLTETKGSALVTRFWTCAWWRDSNLLITGKSTSDPDAYEETRAQLSDSVSHTLGRHQLKLGADFNHITDDSQWDLFFPAPIIFPNLTAFFNHTPAVFWFPFLRGAPSHPGFTVPFTQDVPTAWQPFTLTSYDHNSYGFFAQDEWKATQKLTLSRMRRRDQTLECMGKSGSELLPETDPLPGEVRFLVEPSVGGLSSLS